MTFDDLHKDTDCHCINGINEDTENVYIRRIKKPTVKVKDFNSQWENNKRPTAHYTNNCDKTCGLKGVSVNQWNEKNQEAVIKKYLDYFFISPKSTDGGYIFRFKKDAGLIKHAPGLDKSHYNFYKCDTFSLAHLEHIETITLKDFLIK